MKKQIIGCFAFLLLSATVCINSTAHSASTNTSKVLVVNDTTPPMHHNRSDSNWNKNKMHGDSTHRMNDSSHNMMHDSTKL
jgi:hypothetical protein